jgi:predicted house-cleaning noncanonical NTP pyrophosphatase (MazG superfamily)
MSKVIQYDKLVRDNIPTIVWDEGNQLKFEMLDPVKDKELLTKYIGLKLCEEANEVAMAPTKMEAIYELADLLAVMKKYADLHMINWASIEGALIDKEDRVGGFQHNIILKEMTIYGEDNG